MEGWGISCTYILERPANVGIAILLAYRISL